MPTAIADGPLGLEAIHVLHGRWANVYLNDLAAYPRFELDRISGLHSLPEAEDQRYSPVGVPGEIPLPSQVRGKTLTYEGRIVAHNAQEMRQQAAFLRNMAAERSVEVRIDITPHPAYGDIQWWFGARTTAYDSDEEIKETSLSAYPSPHQRDFTWSVRMSDARFYVIGHDVVVNGASGDVRSINPGTLSPTEPVFVINGPTGTDLVFERYDNFDARKLLFKNVGLAAGQQLRLDFRARTLTRVSDGVDFLPTMNLTESNWWDEDTFGLYPGPTQVRCAGGNNWTCTASPASW